MTEKTDYADLMATALAFAADIIQRDRPGARERADAMVLGEDAGGGPRTRRVQVMTGAALVAMAEVAALTDDEVLAIHTTCGRMGRR